MPREAEQLADQITMAESESESEQQAASEAKVAYADWEAHMPGPWRLEPIECPSCGSHHVAPAFTEASPWGTCSDCDTDVEPPAGTIRHQGRSYQRWQRAA